MVLESLFSAKKIISKPVDMLLLSIAVSIISVFVSYFIFPTYAGVITPLMVTIAMTPVVYRILSLEEEIEREEAEKKINIPFFRRHGETIWLFTLFFLGNLISMFLISILMPSDFVSQAFSAQIKEIEAIRNIASSATASALRVETSVFDIFSPTAFAEFSNILNIIMINNLKVMMFSFLLSFLFGTGALFILSWNASILAVYLASFVNKGLYSEFVARTIGIIPHAPIEMGAYFLAGIAGGILSVGVIREKLFSREFYLVFRDSLILMALSILLIVFGAFVEVYI